MQLVIDIPEEIYLDIKEEVRTKVNTFEHIPFLHEVISVGTPIPEGHGRLVDIGKFEKKQKYADPWKLTRKVGQVTRDWESVELSELPTIVDADNVESEDN